LGGGVLGRLACVCTTKRVKAGNGMPRTGLLRSEQSDAVFGVTDLWP